MRRLFDRLRGDCRGATAIEYGLIVAMIALAAAVGIALFADAAIAMWEFIRAEALGNM